MDVTLKDLFSSVSIIHTKPKEVWSTLMEAYPHGFFQQVIETEFGCLFDDMAKKDVENRVDKIREEFFKEIGSIR